MSHFLQPDTFQFYSDLEVNNNKTWWEANKARYEAVVKAPIEELLATVAPEFGTPKMYRPQRDTRFSADKTPYKDRAAVAVFGKAGTGVYFEVSARGMDIGGGYWMPGKDQLERFRGLVDDPRFYGDLEATLEELSELGYDLYQADAVKTAPRGFSADHPRIHLLRLKHMVLEQPLAPAEWMYHEGFQAEIANRWRQVTIWNDWLAQNVGASTEPPRLR